MRAFSRLGSLLRSGTPIQFRAPGRAASMVLASQARGKGARGINLHQRHRQAPPACMDALPLQAASPSLQAVAAPGVFTQGQILALWARSRRTRRRAARTCEPSRRYSKRQPPHAQRVWARKLTSGSRPRGPRSTGVATIYIDAGESKGGAEQNSE